LRDVRLVGRFPGSRRDGGDPSGGTARSSASTGSDRLGCFREPRVELVGDSRDVQSKLESIRAPDTACFDHLLGDPKRAVKWRAKFSSELHRNGDAEDCIRRDSAPYSLAPADDTSDVMV
jgi:hypothetical protein